MADYIPSGDAELLSWANNYVTKMVSDGGDVGVSEDDITNMTALKTAFSNALTAHNNAQINAKTQRSLKDSARATFVAELRKMTKIIQANPNTNNSHRSLFGITIPDTTPTAVPAPTSRPVLSTDTSNRLQIGVKFTDESTPFSNAKPSGVDAMELYIKIGETAPASIADCVFVGQARKTPHVVPFDSADGGKRVHFLARWVTRSGLTGPTSELTSTTIVA